MCVHERSNSALAKFLDACPGNAFQRVPPGAEAYSLLQRSGAILKKGITLFGTGVVSSLIGVSFTNALIMARCEGGNVESFST